MMSIITLTCHGDQTLQCGHTLLDLHILRRLPGHHLTIEDNVGDNVVLEISDIYHVPKLSSSGGCCF